MDGLLWLVKKSKIQLYRCELKMKSEVNKDDVFLIYESDSVTIQKKVPLESVRKLSRNVDISWELETRFGSVYRFVALNNEENQMWFETLDRYIVARYVKQNGETALGGVDTKQHRENRTTIENYKQLREARLTGKLTEQTQTSEVEAHTEVLTEQNDHRLSESASVIGPNNNSVSHEPKIKLTDELSEPDDEEDDEEEAEESVYLTIQPEIMEKTVLRRFVPFDAQYKIFINPDNIRLLNPKTNEEHVFNCCNIRQVGVANGCFIISMGRNLKYGPGIIALRTTHPSASIIYEYLHNTAIARFARISTREAVSQAMAGGNVRANTASTLDGVASEPAKERKMSVVKTLLDEIEEENETTETIAASDKM